MRQPLSRSRANRIASSGPPTAITKVLMFCTHWVWMVKPSATGSTLRSKYSDRPLDDIWYSDQNTSEPSARIR